jgi:hypothetical protein
MYGPADETAMADWIRQGRVNRDTVLHCHDTNARVPAWSVPAFQPTLGLSPQQVADLLRGATQQVVPPVPNQYHGTSLAYAERTYGGPDQPMISSFPTAGTVLLSIFVPFFALIYYGLVHGNLPRRRPDDPGAGKAIGFMFIPFFNIYWVCFFWLRLCTRINDERERVGLAPTAPRTLVVAILWTYLGMFIPILNILVAIALMVMLLISLIQIQGSLNELADATIHRRQ